MRMLTKALPVVVALVFAIAGCGSDSSSGSSGTTSRVFTRTGQAGLPVPTAEQLDQQLKAALDKKMPDDERLALIEDGELFRPAIPDLYAAISANPNAKYQVVNPVFDNHDGTLTATLRLDKDGMGTSIRTATVHFIALDGRWKLSRVDLCGMLRSANYHTPACG